jgi:hypothetical protein
MSKEYTVTLQISGDRSNHVENFIHQVRKNADDAHRFGVDIDIRRIDNPQEETAEFKSAKEGIE